MSDDVYDQERPFVRTIMVDGIRWCAEPDVKAFMNWYFTRIEAGDE